MVSHLCTEEDARIMLARRECHQDTNDTTSNVQREHQLQETGDATPDIEAQRVRENAGPDNEDAEDDITAQDIPCDTMAATLLLRNQFPCTSTKDVVPFALRSQLYTIVNDRTIVDRELDMLR